MRMRSTSCACFARAPVATVVLSEGVVMLAMEPPLPPSLQLTTCCVSVFPLWPCVCVLVLCHAARRVRAVRDT